jgi:hypothetical protein
VGSCCVEAAYFCSGDESSSRNVVLMKFDMKEHGCFPYCFSSASLNLFY